MVDNAQRRAPAGASPHVINAARSAIMRHDLPLPARYIVAWLALEHNGAAPGLLQEDIQHALGLSRGTVTTALRVLQRRGLLVVTPPRGKYRKAYTLPGCWE